MARSPARPTTPSAAAAAVVAYAAFWAALAALAAPQPKVNVVHAAPSHRPGPAPVLSAAPRIYDEVARRVDGLRPAERNVIARAILEEAARAAIDPLLVLAVIHVESRFDVGAVSHAGAVGLMQLLPPTMREELARTGHAPADPFDPAANVRAGVRYLERMFDAFEDVQLALMAYNAGPNRIRRHLRNGAVPERLYGYPRKVVRELHRLSAATDPAPRLAARRSSAALRAAHARAAPAPQRDPAREAVAGTRAPAPHENAVQDGRLVPAVPAPQARRVRRARSLS